MSIFPLTQIEREKFTALTGKERECQICLEVMEFKENQTDEQHEFIVFNDLIKLRQRKEDMCPWKN